MGINKIRIEDFLVLSHKLPVLDVRSPGEHNHAHVPGAYSLPLFTDEERKVVGTIYKQESREKAIKAGLDFLGPKMTRIVEEAEEIVKDFKYEAGQNGVIVHCWRGGMRSAGVAWLLDLYGFKVYTLVGGYKAFRTWVMGQFEKKYPFSVIGGYTGSGKTLVLKELERLGHKVVDLEGIANHQGSAFGGFGRKQPTQEMFDNLLALKLSDVANASPEQGVIWIEDESQRIGLVNLPNRLWDTLRKSPVYLLTIPFEDRLTYITKEYGAFGKEDLEAAILRIQKRLGGLDTKNAINYLRENNIRECFSILLKYYDKHYDKAFYGRAEKSEAGFIFKYPPGLAPG